MKLQVIDLETGESWDAGIYDLCEWWIETYPEDVFIEQPIPIITVRRAMKDILAMRKHK